MHFQVNCTEADLETGIDWSTVAGEDIVTELGVALGHEFWETLVSEGLIDGDPRYYSEGSAQASEVSHALAVAFTALNNREIGSSADPVARAEAARANQRLDEV